MRIDGAEYDAVIVGGGFYGCCLALFLRSVTSRILLIEAEDALLERASRVNQARVHTGFHYPRSFNTALRSRVLQERFVRDFGHAVVDDFDMLYAIASLRSKVTTARFARMFEAADAPFHRATPADVALFDPELIEGVFSCREFAFDWRALRDGLQARLDVNDVALCLGATVEEAEQQGDRVIVRLSSGREITTGTLFNVTYGNINTLPLNSGLPPLDVKYELAEVALVKPPPELERLAVTVMDGPFFSAMPYPSRGLYSLTHVRYTPHFSWLDGESPRSPYAIAETLPKTSKWRYMVQDARRYMPCLAHVQYQDSLFDVKTVLLKNERDDGRPIFLHRYREAPSIFSITGAKIDNIYDLFDVLPQVDPQWRDAHAGLLIDVRA